MNKYFNTTLGLSMLADGNVTITTLTNEQAAEWLRDGFENVANPTHSNSLQAVSQKLGVDVRDAKGGRVSLAAGDECLVAQISGIPRETREFSDDEIAVAKFDFRLVKAGVSQFAKKIFSFDAETNGLWGDAFAISAAVYENGKLVNSFTAYLGPDSVTDGWVRDNVLPKLAGLAKTHDSYDQMLADFSEFYKASKDGADVIAHMGVPVEAKLLLDMKSKGYIGDWDGPYPLIDIAGVLKAKGYDPTSVDSYNKEFGLMDGRSEAEGLATHHPLYDSVAAAIAYMHLLLK